MTQETFDGTDPFSRMGVGYELGATLHEVLGLGISDFAHDSNVRKLQEIAGFFKDMPDSEFHIRRIAKSNRNPNVPTADHFINYIRLHNQKQELLKQVDELDTELQYYD